jgi:hypothetical protein
MDEPETIAQDPRREQYSRTAIAKSRAWGDVCGALP